MNYETSTKAYPTAKWDTAAIRMTESTAAQTECTKSEAIMVTMDGTGLHTYSHRQTHSI